MSEYKDEINSLLSRISGIYENEFLTLKNKKIDPKKYSEIERFVEKF